MCTGFWWGGLRERVHWGDQDREDNIKMDLQEVGGGRGDWMELAQGQVVGTCGYGEGLSGSVNAGNFLTSCEVYWLAFQEGLCSME